MASLRPLRIVISITTSLSKRVTFEGGVELFDSTKNKPQLTAAGKELLPDLTAALDQIRPQ